jgi:uncharacterized membrane protein
VSTSRSSRREVRNPILALPAAQELLALPMEQRQILKRLLRQLKAQCREQEANAYARRKGPMVAYYMASGTVAGHIANVMAEGR